MKKHAKRRVLALVLAVILTAGGLNIPSHAKDSGQTIAGPEETVRISGELETERESSFNEGWKFSLGDSKSAQNQNFDDSGWTSVTLPHDFSITQTFTTGGEAESGFLPGGTGWYRKSFTLPESCAGKTLVINFDGVYSDAYVYVNGELLGEHHYGYSSFAFDITDSVICDGATENVIAVKAVNNIPSSRWYSGSGIYRDVTLTVTDPVHVGRYGTYITTPDIADGSGVVRVEVDVVNDSDTDVSVVVRNTVYTNSGEAASEPAETTAAAEKGGTVTVIGNPQVSNPKLWSVDEPNLYFVRTEILVDGNVTDTVDTTFGFRYFTFDSKTGFYLNGEALKLNGVCMHHDQGALGSAAYYDAMYRQLSIMKDMGVNAIRTSHNPADEDFIDICNELGLLVVEEAFDGWSVSKNGNSNDFGKYFNTSIGAENQVLGGTSSMTWSEFAIKSMVCRDRNDPSIILWSLGNEIQEGASADSSFPAIAEKLIGWMKEKDTTRPATIGSNQRITTGIIGSVHRTVADNGGIVGFNYASGSELSSMNSAYGAIIASETSSAVNSRSIYRSQASASNADGRYHLTSYDTSAVSWGVTAHASMWTTLTADYVAGEFVWTGFDYIGEPTPWNGTGTGSVSGSGAIPNSSYFGIVETTGFEKDTYYLYRSQWNQKENTLHLVTAWDSDNMLVSGGKTPVVIYSNAPTVELYRNGSLIGTAVRTVHTTEAGHQYYTYTAASCDSDVCTAVSASGSDSLYAAFHVVYEAGTISARAYDENGKEITDLAGNTSVSTPGTVTKLNVAADKTEIDADGSSLAYIAVEVTDANGVLDTRASNTIRFSLSGNGEILGVDNGDQATTAKYQQPSVLADTTSAAIAAYAGKALVIVRSTKDEGSFAVNVSSDGLTGGIVAVTTKAVEEDMETEGLTSYTMVRDYTVKEGTEPQLQTAAAGSMGDGSTVEGTIAWERVPEAVYGAAGDYTVAGTLTFEGQEPLAVSCRLHVIANVIAARNISAAVTPGTVPVLPDVVKGVLANGGLSGEFRVTWDAMSSEQFETAGEIVTVSGTAAVFGDETLPVTASVRVAEAVNTESKNAAPSASSVTQDVPSDRQSDNLNSVNNGVTKPGDNTSERWTNWNNRTVSATAALTFQWDTAQLLSSVNLYYYYDNCCAYPESIQFEYSLNGQDFTAIDVTEEEVETYSLGAEYIYTFRQVINPIALRITFTQQNGTSGSNCVGITEAEIMTYAGKLMCNSSAALSGIQVDGTELSDFAAGTFSYQANGTAITAISEDNAGITILPAYENVVRILTVSEDGTGAHTYEVELSGIAACRHENTTRQGQTEATCTANGYTGDQVCEDCGEVTETGEVIPAKGHTYDDGVITEEPTETAEGIKIYTCIICGDTKEETIPVIPVEKTEPNVTLSVMAAEDGKIALTGRFEDYENISKYYEVTAHGLVYYSSSKLGTRNLTVNTAGRTRVNFSRYGEDGSFTYNMKPAYASTKYTVRAFLAYKDESGRTMYVYSAPQIVSYHGLQ